MNKPDINNLEYMLGVIKDRIEDRELELHFCTSRLGKNIKSLREQEREDRGTWAGKCPKCKTFNEVEREDIKTESGFFGSPPAGHYCRCLHCGYRDVPVRNRKF